jgi:adenosylcobinamide-phosphate synthase
MVRFALRQGRPRVPTGPGLVGTGVALDVFLGEPPARLHPVAAFGKVMRKVESRCWRDERWPGAGHSATGLVIASSTGLVLRRVLGPRLALVASAWLVVAGRALRREASHVESYLASGQDEAARRRLPALVGRDPSELSDKEMARAAVESVAENTVDAVVAPAFWAAVAGSTGALGYRAVNTLDAMVGHRDERYQRFGWASARLDDWAGWLPARITAVLVCVLRPSAWRLVVGAVRRDAPLHPSPNAGVAEAAFAAALGVGLGGESRYGSRIEVRPPLGEGPPPCPSDVVRAVRLSRDLQWATVAALSMPALVSVLLRRRRSPALSAGRRAPARPATPGRVVPREVWR